MSNLYYYKSNKNNTNQILTLIKKRATLEQFYESEDFLYYLYEDDQNCQEVFTSYMHQTDQVILILDYCLFPNKILAKKKDQKYSTSCKYSYMSVQVFDILKQDVVEENSNKYLQYLFSYLDQDELDSTTSQYFGQILVNIFSQENVIRWILMENNEEYLKKFVKHVSNKQIAQQLLEVVIWKQDSKQKFKLLEFLIKKFDEEEEPDSEAIQNISYIFIEIFRQVDELGSRIQKSARVLLQENNLNIIFRKLYNSNDSYNIYYTANILIYLLKNFEVRKDMGSYFVPQIEKLVNLVFKQPQKNNNHQVKTSYDEPLQCNFGQGKMKSLELFYGFLKFFPQDNDLMKELAHSQFYPKLMDLFFKYTTNTMFSFLVENIIVQTIQNNNPDLNNTLIYKIDLVKLIVENYRKNKIFTAYGAKNRQFKKGHVGSLTKIARCLGEETRNRDLQQYLKTNEQWQTFCKNKLQGLTKREEIDWQEIDQDLGNLPQLEHKWISYQLEGGQSSGSSNKLPSIDNNNNMKLNTFGNHPNMMQIEPKKMSVDNKIDIEDVYDLENISLKLVKVKSSEVPLLNYKDPKELMIHCILYGCGDPQCNNKFCRSNKNFPSSYKNFNESNVTQILTSKNLSHFQPCNALMEQKQKEETQKSPIRQNVISSQENIDYNDNFKQQAQESKDKNKEDNFQTVVIKLNLGNETLFLKASGLQPNDKQLIKDVSAAKNPQNNQTLWKLKQVKRQDQINVFQIVNQHYNYTLQMASVYSNDKEHQDVGLGQSPKEQDQQKELWQIQKINNSQLYTIRNLQSNTYLMLSKSMSNNNVDKDVALQKEINQNSSWSIKTI